VCNHLAICLLLDDVGVALGLVLAVGLGVDEGALDLLDEVGVPIYYMFMVLFSKTFIEKINTIIRRFWWAGVQEEHVTSPNAYRSWEDICKHTAQGGLEIRDLELVNKSLITNYVWNVATNKSPFRTAILTANYYRDNSFWTAPTIGTCSVYGSSIMQVTHLLYSTSTLQIHADNSSI
jgi:hypothetical protein